MKKIAVFVLLGLMTSVCFAEDIDAKLEKLQVINKTFSQAEKQELMKRNLAFKVGEETEREFAFGDFKFVLWNNSKLAKKIDMGAYTLVWAVEGNVLKVSTELHKGKKYPKHHLSFYFDGYDEANMPIGPAMIESVTRHHFKMDLIDSKTKSVVSTYDVGFFY